MSAGQIKEKIKEKQQTLSDDQQVEMKWHCQRVAKAKALVLENQLKKKKEEVKEPTEQNNISGG